MFVCKVACNYKSSEVFLVCLNETHWYWFIFPNSYLLCNYNWQHKQTKINFSSWWNVIFIIKSIIKCSIFSCLPYRKKAVVIDLYNKINVRYLHYFPSIFIKSADNRISTLCTFSPCLYNFPFAQLLLIPRLWIALALATFPLLFFFFKISKFGLVS